MRLFVIVVIPSGLARFADGIDSRLSVEGPVGSAFRAFKDQIFSRLFTRRLIAVRARPIKAAVSGSGTADVVSVKEAFTAPDPVVVNEPLTAANVGLKTSM